MKTGRFFLAIVLWLCCLCGSAAPAAHATAEYTYKPNEYVMICSGLSPNRRFSIRAHGDGEGGYEHFHLYLMAEPGHRKIGPLEEVRAALDTAAQAFRAEWSADSRHVAVFYRTDRYQRVVLLYRIQNGRAYPVTGPTLQHTMAQKLPPRTFPERVSPPNNQLAIRWLGRGRFLLKQRKHFYAVSPGLGRALGRFGKWEHNAEEPPQFQYKIVFSAEALCELTRRDRYRIVRMKPGSFEE